ncbi:hypothetical protein AB0O91_21950 [Kitasatospora sp. NPDC089797]|uniref:hypothetical protein n=1 Tax=Kitasatospora sp. NPDC089797 TaxID=3155298 RepID=UPI00344822CD
MLTIQNEAQLTRRSEDAVREDRKVRAAVQAWERGQLAALEVDGRHAEITYGSQEWLQLPLDDPRRAAALIRAAAAWREHCAELPERVICEAKADVELGQGVRDEIAAEVYAQLAAEQAADWGLIAGWAKSLAKVPGVEEGDRARRFAPAREPAASVAWPPVAIPGQPGWHRHMVNGQQVDRADVQGAAA